jgi:hypothetical protein
LYTVTFTVTGSPCTGDSGDKDILDTTRSGPANAAPAKSAIIKRATMAEKIGVTVFMAILLSIT